MAEPRARPRTKGQVFSTPDLTDLLYAYGSSTHLSKPVPNTPSGPPSQTIATLDEILTDFIIETCHAAALSASYSRRQKIKADDFKWVLRRDELLLGRVMEQLWRDKSLKEQRRVLDFDTVGGEGGGGVQALEGLAEAGGVQEEMRKKRRRKRNREEDGGDQRGGKRVAS